MTVSSLERIEADIRHLSLGDQLWLMERLAQAIREQTTRQEQFLESQLAAMAEDAEIQRELRLIDAEFSAAEADGLDSIP